MTDVHSPEVRSKNMRAIRSGDTKPELLVRKRLHAAGFRYRLHGPALPGRPDIVLPKYRTAVFVHGCFWHYHDCRYFKVPKTRPEFWMAKIGANRQRDERNIVELVAQGWHVMVVWECAIRPGGPGLDEVVSRVAMGLAENLSGSQPRLTVISP